MRTLESSADRDSIVARISSLTPSDRRMWGKMSVEQMICHVCDAYRMALGEKSVSPATGLFQRTVMKWFAMQVPLKWPHGVKTLPEMEQGVGGTPPVEFGRDKAELNSLFNRFCDNSASLVATHPFFGPMSTQDWLRWGYLHTDHHLRQFGR